MNQADALDAIRNLPVWQGRVAIEPLSGGLTNRNYLVRDARARYVVRVGADIPVHGILRFNELAASRAAAAVGISPAVVHAAPGLLVLDHVDGRTFTPDDVRRRRGDCLALVRRAHRDIPRALRGPILSFNVFHVLRDYAHTLVEGRSRLAALLPEWLERAGRLQQAAGPVDLVFGHNDLLAANFIDDGRRLWLIDWDYAGFNTPLFDLGGLSSNNGFDADEDERMLEAYFDQPPDDGLRRRFRAVLCASLLRESLWSLVSELHSTLAVDYVAYTAENLARFERAWRDFQQAG